MSEAHVSDRRAADLAQQKKLRDAAREAGRLQMIGPDGKPQLERIGMGWEWRPHANLTLQITRLKERADEFTGELTVIVPKGSGRTDGVVEWARINLLSGQARTSLAKRINEYVESPWTEWLDLFFREVVRRERQGDVIQETDPEAGAQSLRYLLEPVLPLGMPTLLYGSGGTGKSTVAAALALAVQTGKSVIPGWNVILSCPVLILDWEADKWIWQDRINAIARGASLTGSRIKYRPCRRKIVDDAEAIADFIIDHSIGLVIVDAVNQAFGVGSEFTDPAETAIKAFSVIRQIVGATSGEERTATEVTWLLIDHTTGEDLKDNHGVPMKAYGSTAKQWLSRNQFYLSTEGEPTESRQELVMTHTKANYSSKLKPQGMIIERADDGTMRFSLRDELTAPELNRQLSLSTRIEYVLRDGALSRKEICNRLDMTDRAQQKVIAEGIRRMINRRAAYELPTGQIGLPAKVLQGDFRDPDREPI